MIRNGVRLSTVFFLLHAPLASAAVVSNVLTNPGFEEGSGTTNAGWGHFGSSYRESLHPRSGSFATKVFGNFGGPPGGKNYSGVKQTVPAQAGQTWEARAWVSTWSDDPLASGNEAYLASECLDAGGQVLLTALSPGALNSESPLNTWSQLTMRICSPPGTEAVRVGLLVVQSNYSAAGSVWFDDGELGRSTVTNRLEFAGYSWGVYDWLGSPGPNYFSTNCVWVDENGWLHLAIREIDGRWHCAEVFHLDSPGYGEYSWTLGTCVNPVSPDTILGLFTFEATKDDVWNEIDFEITRVFGGMSVSNLQFAVQPWYTTNALYRAMMTETDVVSTHRFVWSPSDIRFLSYWGDDASPPSNRIIASWRYTGAWVPVHSNESANMNFYLTSPHEPADTQQVEMIIRHFRFTPFSGLYLRDDFEDGVRSNAWELAGWWWPYPLIEETNGVLRVGPAADWETAGYMSREPMCWNDKGERFTYSAVLSTVSVQTARTGPDVRTVIELCSESNNAWVASNAAVLFGLVSEEDDSLQFVFQTKTNRPESDGDTRFDAVLTNLTAWLTEGRGIEMQVVMGRGEYQLYFLDEDGAELPLVTNVPGREGPHNLGDSLHNAYWLVGAMNNAEGRGIVEWREAEAGVAMSFTSALQGVTMGESSAALSWPGYFGRTYAVEKTTNLLTPFTNISATMKSTPPLNTFTDTAGNAVGFYRLRQE